MYVTCAYGCKFVIAFVEVRVSVPVHSYPYMQVCVCVCACMYNTPICKCAFIHTEEPLCLYVSVSVHVACMHAYIHTRMHAHIHTLMHI